MSLYFEARLFETRKIGKHIKSTKLMFRWVFSLQDKDHTIVLYFSRLSGKRKILLDNDIYFIKKKAAKKHERYCVEIKGLVVEIYRESGNTFDLIINNRKFCEYYGIALEVFTEAQMFQSYNGRNESGKVSSDFKTQSKLSDSNAIRKNLQTGNHLYFETVASDEESDTEVPKFKNTEKEERLNSCPDVRLTRENREIKSPAEMFDLLDLGEEREDPKFLNRGRESGNLSNLTKIPAFINPILSNNPFFTEMAQRRE